ncbi:unnamed protein product, partial [Adineta steineri]
TLLDFISIDDESLSEKQDLPDLNKIYYELKEQRYVATLTNDTDKQQTENDDNESYNLDTLSSISNLPFNGYRQVFGIYNEGTNTVDDSTSYISQNTHPDLNIRRQQQQHKTEISQTSLQPPINNDQYQSQQSDVAIHSTAARAFSDEKTPVKKFSSSLSNKLINTAQSDDSIHETDERITNDSYEQIRPTQIQSQLIPSSTPWSLNQHTVAPTESQRLLSTSPDEQHNEAQQSSLHQQLQIINDEYPWCSSYYTIIDAETNLDRFYNQLLVNEQSSISTTVNNQNEHLNTQNKKTQDDDNDNGFHIVQRRKRIPSSTTHEQSVSSSTMTTKSPLSPDIDLELIIIHGNPNVTVPILPIIEQTTDRGSKKKQKKKKKDKIDVILFDAPELTLSNMNKKTNDNMKSSTVQEEEEQQQKSYIQKLHTPIQSQHFSTSPDEQYNQARQLQVINDDYSWYSSHYSIIDAESNLDRFYSQLNPPKEQSSIPTPANIKNSKTEDDHDEFHIVQRRKRIPSSTTHDKTLASSTLTTKLPVSPDIDLEPFILHGNPAVTVPTLPIIEQTTDRGSKEKQKKKKHEKTETILFDAPELVLSSMNKDTNNALKTSTAKEEKQEENEIQYKALSVHPNKQQQESYVQKLPTPIESQHPVLAHQQLQVMNDDYSSYSSHYSIIDAETNLRRFYSQPPVDEQSSVPTITTSQNEDLNTQNNKTEDYGDDDGFYIVQRRKRIPSSTTHDQSLSLSTTITRPAVPRVSPDIDLRPAILHGNPGISVPIAPMMEQTTDRSSKKKQKKKKNDKSDTILYDAPELILSNMDTNTNNATKSPITKEEERKENERLKYEDEKQYKESSIRYSNQNKVAPIESQRLLSTSPDEKYNQAQQLQVMNDDYSWYSSHYSIIDAESNLDRFYKQINPPKEQSSVPSVTNIKNNKTEDDHDEFHIVQRRKRIPSSTTHDKTLASSTVTNISPLSPDIDLEPFILHGNPNVTVPVPPIIEQTTDRGSKEKQKKKKHEKIETILFDAPELVLPSMNKDTNNALKTSTVKKEKSHSNGEPADSGLRNNSFQLTTIQNLQDPVSTVILVDRPASDTLSNNELDLRYSLLLDHLDTIIQPILKSSPSETTENQSKSSKIESNTYSHQEKQESIYDRISIVKESLQHFIEDIRLTKANKEKEDEDATKTVAHQQAPIQTTLATNVSTVLTGTRSENTRVSTNVEEEEYATEKFLRSLESLKHTSNKKSIQKDRLSSAQNLPSTSTTSTTDAARKPEKTLQSSVNDTQIQSQLIPSSSPSYSNQYKVTPTESQQLLSTSPAEKYNQTQQQLQVMNDDYSWYSSHYSIIDAESNLDRFYSQLNPSKEQSSTPPTINNKNEDLNTQNNKTEDYGDDDGFYIVQRRKRIPSSTTHDKSSSSSTLTNISSLSPDIDLESFILHGNPNISVPIPPVIEQTTDRGSKKKQKKKKHMKIETVLFDAPELVLSDINKKTNDTIQSSTAKEEKQQENEIQYKESSVHPNEQQQESYIQKLHIPSGAPWYSSQYKVASTESDRLFPTQHSSASPNEQYNQGQQQQQVMNDDYSWYSSHYSIIDAESNLDRFYSQLLVKEQPSVPTTLNNKNEDLNIQNNKQQDDEFHIVQRRKRIPSSTTHDQSPPSSTITTKSSLSPDIDLEPFILHGNPNISVPISPTIEQTTDKGSKKKRKKKKKDKIDVILFDAPELILPDINKKTNDTIQSSTVKEENEIQYKESCVHPNEQQQESYIQKLHIPSGALWYSSQYKVASTESDRLFPTQHSSASPNEQHNQGQQQQLQVMNDDYSWYSSHYSIIDAESNLDRFYSQLNPPKKQTSVPTTINNENEELNTQNNKTEDYGDDDGFHIVQRRKRIPSSTTHDQSLPSSTITTKSPLSPDIDLEPFILHGNPNVPVPIPPIIEQTTDRSSKKKQKKKKNDKSNAILYDAPELVLSNMNKEINNTLQSQIALEETCEKNISVTKIPLINETFSDEVKQVYEDSSILSSKLQQETQPTSISYTTQTIDKVDNKRNESKLISAEDMSTSNTAKINTETMDHKLIEQQSIPEPLRSLKNTMVKDGSTKVIVSPQDDEGFQLVTHSKRVHPETRREKTSSSPSTVTQQMLTTFAELEKKTKKPKNDKQKIISSSSSDSLQTDRHSTKQETILQSSIPCSSITHNLNVLSETKLPSTTKPSIRLEENEDNEGFQVVHHHKHIKSTPRSDKASVSSTTKGTFIQNISHDIDLKPAIIHGHQNSTSQSTPHTSTIVETPPNEKKQVPVKQQQQKKKKQKSSFSTSLQSTSTSEGDSYEIPTKIKGETEKSQSTLDNHEQHLKDSTHATSFDKNIKVNQVPATEHSIKQIVNECPVLPDNQIKTTDKQSLTNQVISSTTLSASNTGIERSTLIDDNHDNEFKVVPSHKRTPSSATSTMLTISEEKSHKLENIKEDIPSSSSTMDINIISSSIEETRDRNANYTIQKVPEPIILAANTDETSSTDTTCDSVTSQMNESIPETYISQDSLKSIVFTRTSEFHDKANDLPTTEQIETSTSKTPAKRRKKKLRIKEKTDDENASTTSASATSTKNNSHINNKSTVQKLNHEEQESKASTKPTNQSFNTSDISSVKQLKPQQIPIKNTSIPSSPALKQTTQFSTLHSTHLNEEQYSQNETNNKLDLFLPEYMRQQLSTSQSSSSSIVQSKDERNIPSATTTTSSDIIRKKKQRPSMLTKDHEAKSLLTNEFDINPDKQLNQEIVLTNDTTIDEDDENIHDDDDEFIVQNFDNENKLTNNSPEQNIDNILTRGFYLWLHEGQALSQKNNKVSSSTSKDLPNAMQQIVIQPTETDEDEDSWNTNEMIKSTYMIGIQSEKKIHMTNAYFINHPRSVSIPSWLIAQANDNTFRDDTKKSHSDDEDDSTKNTSYKKNSYKTDTEFSIMKKSNSNNVQQCLNKHFYQQFNKNNLRRINFDDWAHFLEHKTENNLSTSLEYFYTRTFDEDTLISESLPIEHSIKHEKYRYGDFLLSNNDVFVTESNIQHPIHKSKPPSEYFQHWPKQESISIQDDNDDDEIFICHSKNGLSRRMKL